MITLDDIKLYLDRKMEAKTEEHRNMLTLDLMHKVLEDWEFQRADYGPFLISMLTQ